MSCVELVSINDTRKGKRDISDSAERQTYRSARYGQFRRHNIVEGPRWHDSQGEKTVQGVSHCIRCQGLDTVPPGLDNAG